MGFLSNIIYYFKLMEKWCRDTKISVVGTNNGDLKFQSKASHHQQSACGISSV